MLLKFLSNHQMSRHCYVMCLGLMVTFFAQANDPNSNPWQTHGFIAQGIVDVHGSDYVSDDEGLSFKLTEIGVNTAYQYNDSIRIAAQAVYLNGGNRYSEGIRVDYLLLDWTAYNSENWQTNVYLGRFKNYHWLYSSTRDVPMTRPSIVLPQSVYFDGTRDLSVGGDGVAITTKYSSEQLGEFDVNVSSGRSPISSDQTRIIMGRFSHGALKHDEDLQASIYWRPSYSQWKFGLALTDAMFSYNSNPSDTFVDGEIKLERFYANADFQAENWIFSLELLQEHMVIEGLLFPSFTRDTTGRGGYAQLQLQLSPSVQLLTRYEHYYANKEDKKGRLLEQSTFGQIPQYFGYQHDATIGINYNLSPKLQLQFERHWVKGTARLTPVVIPDPSVNKKEHWTMWAMQLMYWF